MSEVCSGEKNNIRPVKNGLKVYSQKGLTAMTPTPTPKSVCVWGGGWVGGSNNSVAKTAWQADILLKTVHSLIQTECDVDMHSTAIIPTDVTLTDSYLHHCVGRQQIKMFNFNNELVSWCFEPSQPQRVTLGLTTTLGFFPWLFIKQIVKHSM